jgi:hypothetical protein
MGFLDPLLKIIRAPLDAFRSKQSGVGNLKGGFKGDLGRLKNVGNEYKNEMGVVGGAAKQAQGAAGQAGQVGGAQGQGQPRKKKAKMGLFSKKKKCPGCGEKLHVSWDQCPYCGAGAGAPAGGGGGGMQAPQPSQGGGKARTMAIDMGGGGGVASGGSSVGWLVPLEGPQTGELFQLKGRCVVGTAADCDVVLRDGSISGRHAEFIGSSGGYRINDLGSTNGTFVNDKRISSHDLVDNDNVRLGRTNFKFKSMS